LHSGPKEQGGHQFPKAGGWPPGGVSVFSRVGKKERKKGARGASPRNNHPYAKHTVAGLLGDLPVHFKKKKKPTPGDTGGL